MTKAKEYTVSLQNKLALAPRLAVHYLTYPYRVLKTIFMTNDTARWQRNAEVQPEWDTRNQIIGKLIPAGATVLDLGAGAQTLKKYLQPGCEYQPCDLVKSSDDILLCDFNAGVYPKVTKQYDYVVASGVLEYIRSPREFLEKILTLGDVLILSYEVLQPRETSLQRLARGWVNHMTQEQLQTLFTQLGFQWELVEVWQKQVIYRIGASS
jgi:hypothetical protein